ncbi:hypothetical protein FNV43_RR19931 [Rhamnella rubrinervis]|uniref:Homologous recombination OB-fold protein OB-fold domain-containing protein n=1 Tax=Rhamnella rubrinervis TaxID=2594499 RepID=A0A8K0DZF0_9ROSA|nr:hypothetical protein FNV43_RR19931 [Rhamnella rubrinervis]
MEPWEALDVDDSDVPSLLLRPCKRHRLSSPSQPFRSSSSPSKPSSSSSPRLIPGPAGTAQAAMQRRVRNDNNFSGVRDEDPIPTQELIRRVLQNGDDQDDDFTNNPWLSALELVREQGMDRMVDGNSVMPGKALGSIKDGLETDKVDQVVAIIKSCTPNGLGDLMVTLKDLTGTMDASIHRKVLSDEKGFGKDVSVGAALILKKVAVFSPSRSTHYLNVTLSNVVKVISKESGPALKHNFPVAENTERSKTSQVLQEIMPQESNEGIMDSLRENFNLRGTADNDGVTSKTSRMPQETISRERTEEILNSLREKLKSRGSTQDERASSKTSQAPQEIMSQERTENSVSEKSKFIERARSDSAMEGNEKVPDNSFFSHDNFRNKSATAGIEKESTELVMNYGIEKMAFDPAKVMNKQSEPFNSASTTTKVSSAAGNLVVVAEEIHEVEEQRQLLSRRSSPPDWTLEQLDQLLVD